VLGHLPPYLMNGEMRLDVEAARIAIKTRIAEPLGISVVEAARGILAVADNHMMGAIRLVSIERGLDPRTFALMPFGGAGALHGSALARLLGMKTIVIPPAPGVLSALGLLVSSLRNDYSRTLPRSGIVEHDRVEQVFADMEAEAKAWLAAEGVDETACTLSRSADLRYRSQGFEVNVPWARGKTTESAIAATIAGFHARHVELYTFDQPEVPVEIVTLRVSAAGALSMPKFPDVGLGADPAQCILGHSSVEFPTGPVSTAIYSRERLGTAAVIQGPAIFQQMDTTILIAPGQTATIDRYGCMTVTEQE
jgi:N-methylhydantoinase A